MKAHEQSDIAKMKETLTSHSTIWLLSISNSRSSTALPNHGAGFHKVSSAESSAKTYLEPEAYAILQLIDW